VLPHNAGMQRINSLTSQLFPASSPAVQLIADAVRTAVQDILPASAYEIVYHGALGYGPASSPADRLLSIQPQLRYVNLGSFWGADLADPPGLAQGTGARLRHVKVRDEAIVRRAEFRDLITAGWAAGLTGQAALKEAHRGRRR
jgi:hypothetical protein